MIIKKYMSHKAGGIGFTVQMILASAGPVNQTAL
jgi:hypothetical protein